MARQKPDVSQVKHIVETATAEPSQQLAAASSDEDNSDESSASEVDNELTGIDAATLLERGKAALKESKWEDAIRLLESALTKRYASTLFEASSFAESAAELDGDELHPDLAEYWMEYGYDCTVLADVIHRPSTAVMHFSRATSVQKSSLRLTRPTRMMIRATRKSLTSRWMRHVYVTNGEYTSELPSLSP